MVMVLVCVHMHCEGMSRIGDGVRRGACDTATVLDAVHTIGELLYAYGTYNWVVVIRGAYNGIVVTFVSSHITFSHKAVRECHAKVLPVPHMDTFTS